MSDLKTPFWERPLDQLSAEEWEALCDGCGLCCVHKLEDEDTGKIHATNVACDLLNLETCQCSNYIDRKKYVNDCIKLTLDMLPSINWLPETCAYVLRYQNKPLPTWHRLISGDPTAVHVYGISMRYKMIHERKITKALQYYIVKN